MRAMVCERLGDPADLALRDLPSPPMGPDQVRVAVRAAGVNFPDLLMIEGRYQVKPELPFVPGLEVAGEVLECGERVSHVQPGQRVLAFARAGGGYASEIVLPGAIVTPLPESMDDVTAAAFPIAYGTAHFALTHRGHLAPGETLLVLGATGGVGLAAIEVGKRLGARVIAAARGPDKLAVAREHGADEAVDYAAEDLRERLRELTAGRGVDVTFDPVGGPAFHAALRAGGWEGRVLVVGFASGDIPQVPANLVLVKNLSVIGVVFGAHSDRFPEDTRHRLEALFRDHASGALRPRIWKTFPLEQASRALAGITARRVVGKMVLTV